MGIQSDIQRVREFRGVSLTRTLAGIEADLLGCYKNDVAGAAEHLSVDSELLLAAAGVKDASAQIDVVIHAVGILYSLPYLLVKSEFIEAISLGAGNAAGEHDLITSRRLAEFKFIRWRTKGNAVREKSVFEDFVKLVMADTTKDKYLYLLDGSKTSKFLSGKSSTVRLLDRSLKLTERYKRRYQNRFPTVGDFYREFANEISMVDLPDVVPGIEALII
ncbi:MAG: hypothetical protein IIC78_12460 [Chloroflexi bacterium]|nr:hypothetical protein [Chloroflexota bacterium]